MSKFITHFHYKGDGFTPTIQFSDGSELAPLDMTLGLSFDLSARFCIGWHDMTTGENHFCPNSARVDKKFDVCPACQRKTGFNPAFYHAATISPQQEARNAEPHHLYLAYMGKDYIKVGISWHKRDLRRLLDQGARAGLLLETFPTALIARQYEAKIARLDGIHETTSTRTKLSLLEIPVNETIMREQLLSAKDRIEHALETTLSGSEVRFFDTFYTTKDILPSGNITAVKDAKIAGTVEAIVGDILITAYESRLLALPLRHYTGYNVEVSDSTLPLDLDPLQMQLF